jgi:hypothetical protein
MINLKVNKQSIILRTFNKNTKYQKTKINIKKYIIYADLSVFYVFIITFYAAMIIK